MVGTDDRSRITNTTTFPYRAIVQISLWYPNGTGGCTGFMSGPNRVVTAGHCVYNNDKGGFATVAIVEPGRNGESRLFGSAGCLY